MEPATPAFSLASGNSNIQGRRPTMEDAHTDITDISSAVKEIPDFEFPAQEGRELPSQYSFYAVYDGHAGPIAAEIAARDLWQRIVADPDVCFSDDEAAISQAVVRHFEEFDRGLIERARAEAFLDGAAATACLVRGSLLLCANAGDSRAACRYTSGRLHRVTTDHKPGDLAENARIERADSAVVNQYGIDRLAGVLSVSRGIGDMDFQAKGFICTPDVFAIPAQQLDILLLACDGLWDVLDESVLDRAAELLAEALAEPGARSPYSVADAVALQLAHLAIRAGSTDNVTVVVGFRTSLFPPECTDRAPRPTAHFAFDL
eukprot:gnl/Chilomastix_cuspidata/896.p2 GENE.gnl/Chilomastix_cuspidata/896~~gnl/Chilomastix_cuspidata/896.p2  ORF type:complete len:319 (-),score=154.12 gnl/Chilomastix_cuspidata/896:215-1171(-)